MAEKHKQVPVQVRVWVDVGVVPLVVALNLLEGVQTFESCQGYDGEPSTVWFTTESVEALIALGKQIALASGELDYRMQVEWSSGGRDPVATLRVPLGNVHLAAKLIAEVASGHMTGCSDDTSGTSPYNSPSSKRRLPPDGAPPKDP